MQNGAYKKSNASVEKSPDWYGVTNNFILVLFLVYVIAFYMQLTSRWHLLSSIRFEFLLGTLLIFLAFMSKRCKCESSHLINVVVGFFLICLFSFLFTPDIEHTWFIFYTYVVKYSCLSLFIYKFVVGPKELKLFFIALFLAWLKIGQEGFFGTFTGGMMWMNQGVMRLHGPTGIYFHPNSFGGFAIGTLPFVYYFFLAIKNNIVRALLILQLVFSFNIILHSGSRTSYVALFFMLLYLFYQTKHKFKYIIITMVVAAVLVPYIPEQYTDRFGSIFTGQDKAGQSTVKRKEILRDAVSIFAQNPFGVGVGGFSKTRQEYFGREQDTHNLYLQVATNLGIQGLIVFGIMIFMLFKVLNKVIGRADQQISQLQEKINNDGDSDSDYVKTHINDLNFIKAAAKALKMFIAARLILGLFGHDLYEIYWWFSIGIASALYSIIQKSNNKTESLIK